MNATGPGCGQPGHDPGCLCDVPTGNVVPIRSTPADWYNGMLRRSGLELDANELLEFAEQMMPFVEAAERRHKLGISRRDVDTMADGRKLLAAYLHDDGEMAVLYREDLECARHLGPEFDWDRVLGIVTMHNTRHTARINVWGWHEWSLLDSATAEKRPITRPMARTLGVSRGTLERLYALYGAKPYGHPTTDGHHDGDGGDPSQDGQSLRT